MTTYAGRPVFPAYFVDPAGNPQDGVAVTVYNRGTTVKPTLYLDAEKSETIANPFLTDVYGNAFPYLDPGEYDALANGLTVPFSVLADPAEPLAAVGATTATLALSARVTGDDDDRFRLLADGEQQWTDPDTGDVVNYLKRRSSGHLESKSFALRDDEGPSSAPEWLLHSANAQGPDNLGWLIGIDVSATVPARHLAIANALTDGSIVDSLFAYVPPGDSIPNWGVGNASYDPNFRFTVGTFATENATGGLLISVPTTQTGKAMCVRDGSLTNLFYLDGNNGSLFLRGDNALAGGAAVAIKSKSLGVDQPENILAFASSVGDSYFAFRYEGTGGALLLRSISGAADIARYAYNKITSLVAHEFAASAAGGAGTRLPHGTAPSSPVNGDIWTTTAGLFVRINGATVGPLS